MNYLKTERYLNQGTFALATFQVCIRGLTDSLLALVLGSIANFTDFGHLPTLLRHMSDRHTDFALGNTFAVLETL